MDDRKALLYSQVGNRAARSRTLGDGTAPQAIAERRRRVEVRVSDVVVLRHFCALIKGGAS